VKVIAGAVQAMNRTLKTSMQNLVKISTRSQMAKYDFVWDAVGADLEPPAKTGAANQEPGGL